MSSLLCVGEDISQELCTILTFRDPPQGMETHIPVIFLDLNGKVSLQAVPRSFPEAACANCFSDSELHILSLAAEDMSTPNVKEGLQASGMNSILPKEHGAKFFTLPFVKNSEKDVCALVSWDSSIHDSVHLNRVTPANERVYMILKAVVRLSHPASMELVLRKRISINVYKRQSLTEKLRKRIGKAVSVLGRDLF